MEKIFQIVLVFVLLMLIIARFLRGPGSRYRSYDYLARRKPPLPEDTVQRLIPAVLWSEEDRERYPVEGEVDHFLFDAGTQLLFCYRAVGSLSIFRRQGERVYREMQQLAVPLDCIGMALDPQDGRLYFEAGGDLFVYGPVGT